MACIKEVSMKATLRKNAAAAMLVLAPLGAVFVTQPAAAQYTARVADTQGRIQNMSLNSDGGLRPGATLRVQVYGTPGARWASVALGDGIRVPLRERSPGEYVDTHVIRRSEHIDPTRLMTVRAGWGEGPVTLAFNYPPSFQALAMGAAPAVANAEVSRFAMWPRDSDDLDAGRVVHFRVEGTPHARAWVNVPDTVRWMPLRETGPGVYMGEYRIRGRDDPDAFRNAQAVLRSGDQRVMARLDEGGQNYGYGYGHNR
jgi:hypothetical protein